MKSSFSVLSLRRWYGLLQLTHVYARSLGGSLWLIPATFRKSSATFRASVRCKFASVSAIHRWRTFLGHAPTREDPPVDVCQKPSKTRCFQLHSDSHSESSSFVVGLEGTRRLQVLAGDVDAILGLVLVLQSSPCVGPAKPEDERKIFGVHGGGL